MGGTTKRSSSAARSYCASASASCAPAPLAHHEDFAYIHTKVLVIQTHCKTGRIGVVTELLQFNAVLPQQPLVLRHSLVELAKSWRRKSHQASALLQGAKGERQGGAHSYEAQG